MKQYNKSILAITFIVLLASFIIAMPVQSRAAARVRVDILYMNHGPMRPTVTKIKKLLAGYGAMVQASWYDFESLAGEAYMKREGIKGHVPMLIKINGQSDFGLGNREVQLRGFPSGAAPFKTVEGNWSLEDLQQLIDQAVR